MSEEAFQEQVAETASAVAPLSETIVEESIGILPKLSAVLFVAVKPVSVDWLAEITGHGSVEVEEALAELAEVFTDEEHGFSLVEVAGGYQFRTAPRLASVLRRVVPVKIKRLSRAAAETLAVVAYKQPVERAEIESIRGVDALPTLKTLLDAKLIRVIGKQDTPGQPVLYGTTQTFLERFGLRDLSSLPSLHEFEQLLAEPGEVSETAAGDELSQAEMSDGDEYSPAELDETEE